MSKKYKNLIFFFIIFIVFFLGILTERFDVDKKISKNLETFTDRIYQFVYSITNKEKKVYIHIEPRHYQKILSIRDLSINKTMLTKDLEDWVPARINLRNNTKDIKIKVWFDNLVRKSPDTKETNELLYLIKDWIPDDKISKKSDKLKKALIMEKNILQKNNIQKFSNIISKYSDDFARKINSMQIGKKIVIGYGCPARVSTITNLSSIGKKQIKFIIDDSPLKAGKFSPGMNIPIKKIHYLSKKKEYIVIVFAYDYFYEIQKKLISYNCEFYFPIPLKKITT